jgi:NAD+ diphosphatase
MSPDYLDFIPGQISQNRNPPSAADWCLICSDDTVLFTAQGRLPLREQIERALPPDCALQYLGAFRGTACYYCAAASLTISDNVFQSADLRTILREQETPVFDLCCRALHLLTWRKRQRYCGACGHELMDKDDELARQCKACGLIVYPRISPAVIVAVIRDNTILLARGKRSRLGFYSVLAGFVEPGETLEGCVRREVFEETRIELKNIRYFGSQPWPLPDSLMVGFIAEYAGGDLRIDEKELETAGWFGADALPQIPTAPSISRKLIEWFIDSHAAHKS